MKKLMFVFALLIGCVNISSMRNGGLYPPNPSSCKIQFENLNFQEASAAYETLGLITVSGGDVTEGVREQVRKKACAMGGDAVSLNGAVDSGSRLVGNMTQFLVLRKKQAAPVPPQQTST
jgi:hypothetical protein